MTWAATTNPNRASPSHEAPFGDEHLFEDADLPIAEVIELSTRRPLPPDRRPLPSVDKYDQLLSRRTQVHPLQGNHMSVSTDRTTATDCPARPPKARAAAPGVDVTDAAIDESCRVLHLPTIRGRYHQVAADALREHASYKQFLAQLLGCGVTDRDERRKIRLVREAGCPRPKRLEDFDFAANPHISPAAVNTMASTA